MAIITLDKEVFAQEPVTTSEVSYDSIIDNSSVKSVVVEVTMKINPDGSKIIKPLVLWEGAEYDEIGQWTDEQAEMRIKELLEK
jgi:hypothetical protein